jgi:hypothetical protein
LEWEVSGVKVVLDIRGFKMDTSVEIIMNRITLSELQVDAVMFAIRCLSQDIKFEIDSCIACDEDKELYRQLGAVKKIASLERVPSDLHGWQPIETAPRDESFLAYIKPNRYCIGSIEEDGFMSSRGIILADKPSHWMALTPPK